MPPTQANARSAAIDISTGGDEIVFASHLPLVRIGEDSVPFDGCDLWRMPFATFDALTGGAFANHARAYEAVAPVFLRMQARAHLLNVVALDPAQQRRSLTQIKMPHENWATLLDQGLGSFVTFYVAAVWPVWQALVLQAPGAVLPPPGWSLTFAIADPGFGVEFNGTVSQVVSVQGEADIDYLISEGFATTWFDGSALAAASDWATRLSTGAIDSALRPALKALGSCASPLLGPVDRTVVATMALESLLLPEARSGMSATLERRLGHLLGRDDNERESAREAARALYKLRSASVHGEASNSIDAARTDGAAWLAATITALNERSTDTGVTVTELLQGLDQRQLGGALPDSSSGPRGPALLRPRVSNVSLVASSLGSPDDAWLLWAPLPGLVNRQPLRVGYPPDPRCWRMLLSLSGNELLSLEERDIRRDFAATLRLVEDEIAALCIVMHDAPDDSRATMSLLQQERDLVVAALRLAGLHDFCDPALSGVMVMRGQTRFRQPSVLRQSIWQIAMHKQNTAVVLRPEHAEMLAAAWGAVDGYRRAGRHPDLDRALSLLLRGFDRQFLTRQVCAGLHYGAIEALLGRFRPLGDRHPLEMLVARLLGEQDVHAAWFRCEGRVLRNAIAHDRAADAVDDLALDALASIAAAAWRRAAQIHASEPAVDRPGKRLIRSLRQ